MRETWPGLRADGGTSFVRNVSEGWGLDGGTVFVRKGDGGSGGISTETI